MEASWHLLLTLVSRIQALEEVQEFHQLENSLQIRQVSLPHLSLGHLGPLAAHEVVLANHLNHPTFMNFLAIFTTCSRLLPVL